MRIGIFFGGQSREREISFAGGRTVFDNLNKSIFEAIPIFIDSLGNFILLDWQYIYKGTIRDFYPPVSAIPQQFQDFQLYIESLGNLSTTETDAIIARVGKPLNPQDLPQLIDFAFLCLHGAYGEDGNIQGLLEWYGIPYSGSGILASAIGIDKGVQKQILKAYDFPSPKSELISIKKWQSADSAELYNEMKATLGFPMVVKSPHQGSSIGISVLKEDNVTAFVKAVNKSFFIQQIDLVEWNQKSESEKRNFITAVTDIRQGVGLPLLCEEETVYMPQRLWEKLDNAGKEHKSILLSALHTEEQVLIESYIEGTEFSCIVIQNEIDEAIALPPTQIIKYDQLFDYRAKYLPGMSRKVTPIDASVESIDLIRKECCRLFNAIQAQVYARIDGFLTTDGQVFLNDPNTTSGMLPSSFFFHQAAEIGLNPSQFLSYIIRTSIAQRLKDGKKTYYLRSMLNSLDEQLKALQQADDDKIKVGVIMGGFSSERHISVESGRNIYEKLSSSDKYRPIPVFLSGNEQKHELYLLPINMMLKDNADDISEKIGHYSEIGHPVLEQIKKESIGIRAKYTSGQSLKFRSLSYAELADHIDMAFIALHGRPGEDGAVQAELERINIPYNGSDVSSSQVTINKYETNRKLRAHGILVADHRLVYQEDWADETAIVREIEVQFSYPFIAKPADDGCSSAVKKIKNRAELTAFARMMFRPMPDFLHEEASTLKLKTNEEFPQKKYFLIEDLIERKDARHFLEITGGLLTHMDEQGNVSYEVFEPSETLATGEVLSLEEKFLAGEGQNITPARFDNQALINQQISQKVRQELEKTAKVLGVQGYARIDAFVRIYSAEHIETIIIEVNSLPGMTPATCIFHQTAINNYKPYDFIDSILDFGKKRMEKQKSAV